MKQKILYESCQDETKKTILYEPCQEINFKCNNKTFFPSLAKTITSVSSITNLMKQQMYEFCADEMKQPILYEYYIIRRPILKLITKKLFFFDLLPRKSQVYYVYFHHQFYEMVDLG